MGKVVLKVWCFVSVAAVVFASFSPLHPASAAETTQRITASPGRTTITIDAGTTIRKSFDVINGGTTDYIASLSVSPYSVTGDDYTPSYTPQAGNNITPWITLEQSEKEVAAMTPATFFYTVSVPANTKPGGYYAVIFAKAEPKNTNDSNLIPHGRVGNVLYITVSGPLTTSGIVVKDDPSHFAIGQPFSITLAVKNTGELHFLADTTITIRDLSGSVVKEARQQSMILPDTTRDINHDWTPTAPFGIYLVDRSVTINGTSQSLPRYWVIHLHPWIIPGFIIIFIVGESLLFLIGRRKRHPNISKS